MIYRVVIHKFPARGLAWAARQSERVCGLLTLGMLAVSYFILIAPLAIMFRLSGRDLLRLRRTPRAHSTWKVPGPDDCELNMLRPF